MKCKYKAGRSKGAAFETKRKTENMVESELKRPEVQRMDSRESWNEVERLHCV